MNRKHFVRSVALSGLGFIASNAILRAGEANAPIFPANKEWEQLGFNHIPNKENRTMNTVLHKAESRGHANHGWLNAKHSFSFANYYNPERMHFGVLRVLNDDSIAGGKGFGTHPHDNMEIITIPFQGDLAHKDNMGNSAVIKAGDVQVMSAGTGIYHSEFNNNPDSEVKLLQIWVFPNKKNVKPRYDQTSIRAIAEKNTFYQILSPNEGDKGVWIHQNAWFHMGEFDDDIVANYKIKKEGNGVYVFVLQGEVEIEGQKISKRDGFGIWDVDEFNASVQKDTQVLLMEVPMDVR